MKQMFGRCQGYNVLEGIHFLFNRRLRTCLSAVAYMEVENWCVLSRECMYFWVDFENEYTPKKAYDSLNFSMYAFATRVLWVLRLDSKRQTLVSGETVTKYTVMNCDDTWCSLACRLKAAASQEDDHFQDST